MTRKNPTHPGLIVLHDCMEPLGLNVAEAAAMLGVSKKELDDVVNCRGRISADMAIRLEKGFGSTAETWGIMQTKYDIAQAKKQAHKIKVSRAVAVSLRPQPNI